eukprot:COSAG02_NODE_4184_length_5655_cov_2.189885_1_plen_81_part_00
MVSGRAARRSRRYGTRTTVRQIPEVRARAAARGPTRSSQPGYIEFGRFVAVEAHALASTATNQRHGRGGSGARLYAVGVG